MISINGLYKRYHQHKVSDWILEDVNLTFPRGTSVGLLGANGAGKSTLLRLIAGMDIPDRGEVYRGCRVSWPIGLSGGLKVHMSGKQNVKFVARIHGYESRIPEIVRYAEEFSDIGEYFDEPVRTYSSGMRARLLFGLSLAFDFDVYLSDEATSVGDRNFKNKAKKAFKQRVGKSSVIIVSHSEGILKEICQAGVLINNGKAYWYDSIDNALEDYHQTN